MINLRCAIAVPGRTGVVELEVTAPAGSTLHDVEDQLWACAALPRGTRLRVGERRLDRAAAWGRPPLLHGCLLVSDGSSPDSVPTERSSDAGVLVLHVVGGPDSGRRHLLRPGDHILGRAASSAVQILDDDVSRHHAVLHVGVDGLRVSDLGSTNGTQVAGVPVGTIGAPLGPGERLHVGRSTLVIRAPGTRPAVTRLTGTGTVEVHRPPRQALPAPDVVIRRPARPGPPPRPRSPWLSAVVPLLVAVPLALLAHQPMFLLFALLSPLVLLGTALSDRWGRRRDHREALATWEQADARAASALSEATRADLVRRRRRVADPAEMIDLVETPSGRLWERTPDDEDLLQLSVGTGRVASAVRVADGTQEREEELQDAPVVVSLVECGHLGLTGPRERVAGLARWLVSQVIGWHGHSTAHVVALAETAQGATWAWLRWLPHARPLTEEDVERMVVDRKAAAASRSSGRGLDGPPNDARLVVVVDGDSARTRLELALALSDGPTVGVHLLWLARPGEDPPAGCRAVVEVRANGTARVHVTGREPVDPVTVDAVGEAWAWRVARALAPLREAGSDGTAGDLPTSVALLDLHDVDLTDASAVAQDWADRGRTTEAPVGVTEHSVATIDLRRDGPHALVGGTTGSGKSELLRTLVTSLAMRNRPDEMSFVLVDYKGGAAFAGCADLPHVAGLVTDLDDHLADRALTSLQAELTRRERLLADAGARDLEEYQQSFAGERPPLPRLVLVIDEFRVLAHELPSFLGGLVRVAAVGRSLGVHLVLATQRPAGVVSADIKANVNLRIALRVRDRADSEDVLDTGDAAHLPQHLPGRALARTGGGPLTAFQVARVAVPGTRHAPQVPRVRAIDDAVTNGSRTSGWPCPAQEGRDVLSGLTEAAQEAARRLDIEVPASPWLPPLPECVDAVAVAGRDADRRVGAERPGAVALGLLDLPRQQAQPPLMWHPVHDGHLGIVGGHGSGRTTALATLLLGLTRGWPPSRLQLHIVAAGGPLRGLASMPHVGTVLSQDRPTLVARLVSRLTDQLARRRHEAHGAGVPNDAPSEPSRGDDEAWAPVVLVVDGWDAVLSALETVGHGQAVDDLLALVRDGASAGLRVVLTGGRDLLLGRVASLVSERLLLRTSDPTDLLLAGLPPTAVPAHQPPGRAVRVSDGAQVQIAVPGGSGSLSDVLAAGAEEVRRRWGSEGPHDLVRVRQLPSTVRVGELRAPASRRASGVGRWAVVGLGGDEAAPCGLNLDVDPVVVVSGPAGSGRTTALRTMACSLTAAAATVVTISSRGGLQGPWSVCAPDAPERLSRVLREHPNACVLVDDVELLADSATDAILVQLARRRGPTALVVAGATSTLQHALRGAGAAARAAARTGLVLQPSTPSDGEVLGVRVAMPESRLPGRGVLVVRGEQQPVQVAQ